MRSCFSILAVLTLGSGCASLPDSPLQDAPTAHSFVEREGTQIPLYALDSVRASHLMRPEYPKEEKANGLFGEAIIRVLVGADGHIAELEIRKSTPSAAVGESARKAVAQWHFPRFAKAGVNLTYFVDVPVVFAPEGTPIL